MMSIQPTDQISRRFEFDPTEAVARSRANARFISCPACRADTERYLFHERGARFVQCRSCDVGLRQPARARGPRLLRRSLGGGNATIEDREHVRKELTTCCATRPTCIAPIAARRPRAWWSPVGCLTT